MKNRLFLKIACFCICFTTCLIGCKKDDPKPTCRISSFTTQTGTVTNITYLPNGKTNTITRGNLVSNYTYSGNNYEIVKLNAGSFVERDSVTVNSNGLAVNVRNFYNTAGDWINYAFQYSGTELNQIRTTYSLTYIIPSTITVIWSNGNPISFTYSGSGTVENLTYYTDVLSQSGDKWDIDELLKGYKTIKARNALLSKESPPLPVVTYDYIFDDEGKIIKINFGAGGTGYNDYTYLCN